MAGGQQAFAEAATTDCPYPGGFEGRGIVICAGGEGLLSAAYVCIGMLRKKGCDLPVQIWHLGSQEIPDAWRPLWESIDVELIDAYQVREAHPARILNGWEIKPYSIKHCRFKEVLLLDADNVPIVDPEFLFETPQFAETGAIFWPDYNRLGHDRQIWSLCQVPYRDEPEFESGQIVVDKERCWHAISLTVVMNEYSDFFYGIIHGDKDTYHMAWRRLGQAYSMPTTPIDSLEGVMCQHDFEGTRIFQHRNFDKWNLYRDPKRIDRFEHHDDCVALLHEVRGIMADRFGQAVLAYEEDDEQAAGEELATGTWLYRRIGHDERQIRFGMDGKVSYGYADCERWWRLTDAKTLEVIGEDGVTFRCERNGDGHWHGAWLLHEKMGVELRRVEAS